MKKIFLILLIIALSSCQSNKNMDSEKISFRINIDLSSISTGNSILIATAAACIKVEQSRWPIDFKEINRYLLSRNYSLSSDSITEYTVNKIKNDLYNVTYTFKGESMEKWNLKIDDNGGEAILIQTLNRVSETKQIPIKTRMKHIPFKTVERCNKLMTKIINDRT